MTTRPVRQPGPCGNIQNKGTRIQNMRVEWLSGQRDCYGSILGSNPDITQKSYKDDIIIGMANPLQPAKKYIQKSRECEPQAKILFVGVQGEIFSVLYFNTASSAAPQIPLCRGGWDRTLQDSFATSALAVRRSYYSDRSHPHRLDLIHQITNISRTRREIC